MAGGIDNEFGSGIDAEGVGIDTSTGVWCNG